MSVTTSLKQGDPDFEVSLFRMADGVRAAEAAGFHELSRVMGILLEAATLFPEYQPAIIAFTGADR